MAACRSRPLLPESVVQAGASYLLQLFKPCSGKYAIDVAYDEKNSDGDAFRYTVTLSTPTPQKPVPEVEAHVHFVLSRSLLNDQKTALSIQLEDGAGEVKQVNLDKTKKPENSDETPGVVFWFETQNVKHTLQQTLPQEKLEGWIDRTNNAAAAGNGGEGNRWIVVSWGALLLLYASEAVLLLRYVFANGCRIIEAKLQLRQENKLRTPFETTRMNPGSEDIEDLVREQKKACLKKEAEAEEAANSAATREALAAAATEAARQADRDRIFNVKGQLTPRMLYEAPPEKLCIEEVLQKVLNAADEDREGGSCVGKKSIDAIRTAQFSHKQGVGCAGDIKELAVSTCAQILWLAPESPQASKLPHKTVAGVLRASPLGLQRWDLALLLAAAAHEGRDGYVRYGDFVEEAPDIIRLLRERRKVADQRVCSERVTDDAVSLLYKDEMEETWRIMREIFEAAEDGAAATGKLPRGTFLECLQSRPERLALREVTLLMQVAPTDEEGLVEFYAFPIMLRILRRESINHAVLETNAYDLQTEILNALQKLGYDEMSLIPLWTLREALTSTQLCLSRIQIHALLCMLDFDRAGLVRCDHFLQTVCEMIPPFFDRAQFTKKAEFIAKEIADAAARAELEELQGLTGGGKSKRKPSSKEGGDQTQNGRHDSHDDFEKGDAPDKETVEKTLIHLFTVVDDKRRGTIPLQTFISAMRYWATSGAQQQNSRSPPTAGSRQQDSPASAGGTGKTGTRAGVENSSSSAQSTATTCTNSKRTGAVGAGPFESSKGAAAGGNSATGGASAGTAAASPTSTPAAGSAAAAAERRYADVVASCKLTVEEVTGLIAEVEVDEHQQEVTYHEHIKTWIPTVFEIRKSPIFYQLIHNRGEVYAKSRSFTSSDSREPATDSQRDRVSATAAESEEGQKLQQQQQEQNPKADKRAQNTRADKKEKMPQSSVKTLLR